jgi:hypothetical protein
VLVISSKPVRQGTFAVVNMGDNTKIPDIFHSLQK